MFPRILILSEGRKVCSLFAPKSADYFPSPFVYLGTWTFEIQNPGTDSVFLYILMSLFSFQSRTTDYSNKCLLILRQDNISERDGRSSMCLFVCSQSLLFGSTTTSQIKKQLISLIRPISLTLISQSQMETFIEFFFFFFWPRL